MLSYMVEKTSDCPTWRIELNGAIIHYARLKLRKSRVFKHNQSIMHIPGMDLNMSPTSLAWQD